MRIKVCGIRCVEDALLAAELGVDAIGLLVGKRHRSEDFLSQDEAKAIAAACPPLVTPVLVTHIENADEVVPLALDIGVFTIQMHNDCGPKELESIRRHIPGVRIIRAIHATGDDVIEQMKSLRPTVDAFVIDSINKKEDRVGGTGLTHDWNLSRRAVLELKCPIVLAGGLNPGNVAAAIDAVRPFAVDANTGLRGPSGFKDRAKVLRFVSEAKRAFLAVARSGGDGVEPRGHHT
jgi:phosphoribosylanthranilate isomerase